MSADNDPPEAVVEQFRQNDGDSTSAQSRAGQPARSLTAYYLGGTAMQIQPAPGIRRWMDETVQRSAYRCLPMVIANQAGWLIENGHKVAVTWAGGAAPTSLRIEYLNESVPQPPPIVSIFGSGVVTWLIPYVFRTSPEYNLLVRGPANCPKDGAAPLEGIVETDWVESTFSMNWKITRPNHRIVFEVGEPIAMLVPQQRGELETFRPDIQNIQANPELCEAVTAWVRSRVEFTQQLQRPGADKTVWQKHYIRGVTVAGKTAPAHQNKLALEGFTDRRDGKK